MFRNERLEHNLTEASTGQPLLPRTAVGLAVPLVERGNMSFWARFTGGGDDDEESSTRYQQEPASNGNEPSLLERARGAVGMQPTRREEAIDSVCPSLTFKQRLWGFAICFGIGVLISLGSMRFFHKLLHGNPTPFAINYTLGNLISIGSTGFLVGPKRQLKRMSHPTRAVVALVFVLAAIATLVCALVLPHVTNLSPHVLGISATPGRWCRWRSSTANASKDEEDGSPR